MRADPEIRAGTRPALRWLEWTLISPLREVGGVEIHLLSMAETLKRNDVEVRYSSAQEDLFENDSWDVIHTHGNALPKWYGFRIRNRRPLRIHTLHGTSLGVMKALRQPWRITFWKGAYRELSGCWNADIVCSVNPDLLIFKLFKRLSRIRRQHVMLSENAWNASQALGNSAALGHPLTEPLRAELERRSPFWCFIGRGTDAIKGAERIQALLARNPPFQIVAVPGDGFEEHPALFKTGRLSPQGVSDVLKLAQGLLVSSKSEGGPLVALEALAEGTLVHSTRIGILPFLEREARGLSWMKSPDDPQALTQEIAALQPLEKTTDDPQAEKEASAEREARKSWNRARLATWEQSALSLLEAVRAGLLQR